MPTDFPLWRLRPEEAARIIILAPQEPVERHKFWHKREMRLRPSKRNQPKTYDERALNLAKADNRWTAHFEEWEKAFPMVYVLVGPLLEDGRFYTYREQVLHPLGVERQREPWQGMYSRRQYEADVAYIEEARALLRENFILGQRNEGPYLDGIVFLRTDSLLLAEQLRCKNRLQMTWALIEASRKSKGRPQPSKKIEHWKSIGADEAVAMQFKQSGYEIRKIDTLTNRHYEVKIK